MATLREFILSQSTLPTGNLVRDHIDNPSEGSGGSLTLLDGLVLEACVEDCYEVEIDIKEFTAVIDSGYAVEIDTDEIIAEVC